MEHTLGVRGAPAPPPDSGRVLAVLVAVIGGYIVGSAIGAAVVTGSGGALWIPAVVEHGARVRDGAPTRAAGQPTSLSVVSTITVSYSAAARGRAVR